jgi:hypothetical protein
LVDNTALALPLFKNWIGQPNVEAWEIEELEQAEWVDEGSGRKGWSEGRVLVVDGMEGSGLDERVGRMEGFGWLTK